jgi:multisubunit Na+/H+ antiporter MnhF subunit
MISGIPAFFSLVLIICCFMCLYRVLGFVGTLALAKYLEGKQFDE